MYSLEQILFIVSYTCISFFLFIFLRIRGHNLNEPAMLILTSSSLAGVFLTSHLVIYDKVFNVLTFSMVIFSILFFLLGTSVIRKNFYSRRPSKYLPINISSKSLSHRFIILFAIIYIIYFVFTKSGSLFQASTLNSLYIEKHFEYLANNEKSFNDALDALFFSIIFVSSMYILFIINKKDFLISKIILIIAAVIFFIEAVLTGTRFILSFSILVFIMGCSIYFKSKLKFISLKRSNVVIYIFAFIFLFYSFIIFPVARNPVVAQSTYYAMNRHHESEFGSYVEASKNSTLFNWLPIFAFSTSYISHPYAKFTFFSENNLFGDYGYGAYNFPIIERVGILLDLNDTSKRSEIREKIASISRDSGYTRNPWSTGIRDLILDFGLLGSLIFMFLYGCTAQYFYERSLKSSNPFYIIGGSFVLASCILFPFLSPFGLNSFINPLLILIVIYYLSKLRFRNAQG